MSTEEKLDLISVLKYGKTYKNCSRLERDEVFIVYLKENATFVQPKSKSYNN